LVSGSDTVTTTSQTILDCGTMEEDFRIIGMPTLHIGARMIGTSGHLFVEMQRGSDGSHLGHAVMDLRFADGGKDGVVAYLPGTTVLAQMEFFAMDVVLEAGDNLVLVITQTGEDYIPSTVSTTQVSVFLDDRSTLSLSTVTRTCEDLFLPPMQEEYPMC
ncbi:MAG: CocE/NonD family hydrolase C-terminal non-catalytic domain-containing protein, partial [Candidatus Thalassarchaeaceae archaeon]|nr:CocE/NonD family hydrolase C-terminal non-catalytic domain-containing protein [Candidatus Thalassarchaeaceae archaeon]